MMKKLFFLLPLLLFFSCKKEEIAPSIFFNTKENLSSKNTITQSNVNERSDSVLFFDTLQKMHILDKMVITNLKKERSKDHIETTLVRLDFYQSKVLLKSFEVSIYTGEEGEWNILENNFFDYKTNKSDCRFFEVSYGVPACGYTHSNFLFFIDGDTFQLIQRYDSMGDGPYGSGLEFDFEFSDDKVTLFTTKHVVIESDESKPYSDEDEALVKSFSDSTLYVLKAGLWKAKRITPKQKVYRKEFKTFNQLYPKE